MTPFDVLNNELERLHEWYGMGEQEFNLEIWKRILMLQDVLVESITATHGAA